MIRYDCLKALKEMINDELVVASLGVTSDEWHAVHHREANLYLSAMGYTIPVGLGLAFALPHRKIVVMESDGSLLLGLSCLATLGVQRPSNMAVFVFDNECYESIGGPPSHTAFGVDLAGMAQAAGIKEAITVRNLEEFTQTAKESLASDRLSFVVAKIEPSIAKVPPKSQDILENKYSFVRYVEKTENKFILSPPSQKRKDAKDFVKT